LLNFLMEHFHSTGLRGADGTNGPHAFWTWYPWTLFLGLCEEIIFSVHTDNIQHWKQRVTETSASVTPDVLGWVWQ
jgi:hypothetical protein